MGRSHLNGCVVLVVEDETLVRLDLAETLLAAGAQAVCAKNEREAFNAIERFALTAAVIDINLGGHDCTAVCQHLRERGIPFLFHTGYNSSLADWKDIPIVKKPSLPQDMVAAVHRLCGLQQAANSSLSEAS